MPIPSKPDHIRANLAMTSKFALPCWPIRASAAEFGERTLEFAPSSADVARHLWKSGLSLANDGRARKNMFTDRTSVCMAPNQISNAVRDRRRRPESR